LQLIIFAAGLEREDQEKIWRLVSTYYERTGDLPSLEDLRSEVEAMGTARAAAGGGAVMKEKMKPEEVGMEFSGAVIRRGPKIQRQVVPSKDREETDDEEKGLGPVCF